MLYIPIRKERHVVAFTFVETQMRELVIRWRCIYINVINVNTNHQMTQSTTINSCVVLREK